MFAILAETHKLIAEKVYNNILQNYGVKLNLDKLKWGSVSPDVLPYYKLKRHYKDESIRYISKEIVGIISISKYYNFTNKENTFFTKFISNRLGVILHYLCDYTTYPHAYRLTFIGNMRNHIKYESDLNKYSKNHEFNKVYFNTEKINIYDENSRNLIQRIEDYINELVDQYMKSSNSFSNDLDYALELCNRVSEFIMDTIVNYTEDMDYEFI